MHLVVSGPVMLGNGITETNWEDRRESAPYHEEQVDATRDQGLI
jgi:hypothetical protein